MTETTIDWSLAPTAKEKEALGKRHERLAVKGLAKHLEELEESLRTFTRPWGTLEKHGLRLRTPFSCLRDAPS